MDESSATVSLTADVAPFEQMLGKAAATADQWASKVEGSINSIYEGTEAKLNGWMDDFTGDFSDGFNEIKGYAKSITDPISNVFSKIGSVGSGVFSTITQAASKITSPITGAFTKVGEAASAGFSKVGDLAKGMTSRLEPVWTSLVDGAKGATSKIGSLLGSLGSKGTTGIKGLYGSATEDNFAKLTASLSSASEKDGEQLGGMFGSAIGTGLGAMIGGPIGAKIGMMLGEIGGKELSNVIDFEGITKALNELAQGVQPIRDKFKENWTEMRGDATSLFESIRDKAQSINIRGLLKGEDGAWDDLVAKAQHAWDEVGTFGERMAYRFEETLDTIWNSVQAPLAKVADWIQLTLQKLGLIDEGTKSWGESLLEIQNVGEQALGSIGYGVGYLQGVFTKAGGYILEYFGVPLQKMYASLVEGIGKLISATNDLSEATGMGRFESLDKMAEKLASAGRGLRDSVGDTLAKAKEWQQADPNAMGNAMQDKFKNWGNAGKSSVEFDRAAKGEEADNAAYIAELLADAVEVAIEDAMSKPADELTHAAGDFEKATSALVAGSRESANAIVQAQNAQAARAAAAANPQDPARAAAENTAKNTEEAADTLEEIASIMRDSPMIIAV